MTASGRRRSRCSRRTRPPAPRSTRARPSTSTPAEPPFSGPPEAYPAVFRDEAHRHPWIQAALAVAGLPRAVELRAGAFGTFPTYLTGTGLVVKLFPDVEDGGGCHAAEVGAARVLASSGLPVPAVVAVGELYPDAGLGADADGWTWPFLVTEEASGAPLAAVADQLSPRARLVLAEDVGSFLRTLHGLRGPTGTWDAFLTVLERRHHQVLQGDLSRHGHLAGHLLEEIPAYLARFPDDVRFDVRDEPTFLHADLHHDHLFVDPKSGHLQSVIDWGDLLEGDRWYDFGALVTGSFHAERAMTAACFDAYGERPDPEVQLARMLLHGFDLFDAVPDEVRKGSRTLEELAHRLTPS